MVKFLASRGLRFRGDDEILGFQKNGNYLKCINKRVNTFLADHIQNYRNHEKEVYHTCLQIFATNLLI